MTIALYGGSFDPPHIGHFSVVTAALEALDIDKLIIVPAYLNPFKTAFHADPATRLEWLKKLFSPYSKVEVSDLEISQGRPVPSIETVRHYTMQYEKIYFIIGADNLPSLRKWHRFEELDGLVTWVVATRRGMEVPRDFLTLAVDVPVSSTQLREAVDPRWLPPEIASDILAHYNVKESNGKTH